MTTGDFRFGINLLVPASRQAWRDKCRRAEELGFDAVLVPDHLGMVAPFPAVIAAAEATESVDVGTFVLNAPFYNPTLLARDVAGAHQLTGGRLELGLGAGYVQKEFEEAGIPFERPGRRVDHLERVLDALEPGPRLLVAGNGDRVLRLAATRADVVGFAGGGTHQDGTPFLLSADQLADRAGFAAAAAGDRVVQRNILVHHLQVTGDPDAALRDTTDVLGNAVPAELITGHPAFLIGTAGEIADQLRAHRDRFGITYFTLTEDHLTDFAPVIALLRQ